MYLKSLKLVGFKSFADRSRLEFRPGVTVIVGPNGSGKSNLVDALSWVLGTQSPKSLRTPKMEDVIFAGTASRPALNRAEVTLVIDNGERLIDLDLDEVAITRRLYRDGSSDYELNGVGCRLVDVQDLLSDSGVGRHQHVIIGQGEIGQVLNASPEDHRAVIEEAAGILKHKRRKERAERRLERTDVDLTRLADIVGEIQRQMRPLKRQARAAEAYDGLKQEVVALRLYLGGRALAGHNRELTMLISERAALREGMDVHEAQLTALTERLGEIEPQVRSSNADLERATSAAAVLETTAERLRRISSVAAERRRASTGRVEAEQQRLNDLATERVEVEADLALVISQHEDETASVAAAESAFRRQEDHERGLATQATLSPEGAVAAVRGELSSLEVSLGRDLRECESIDRRLGALQAQAEEESAEVDRLNHEVRALDADTGTLQAEYEKAALERKTVQSRWETAESALHQARVEVASANARVDAIRAAIAGRSDEAARELAVASPGSRGPVVGRLEVPEGLEQAVQTALGDWADAISFESAPALKAAAERVRGTGGGAVPLITGGERGASQVRVTAQSLGFDLLVDRLGPEAEVVAGLIGDVILVEGWATGWDLVSRHPEVRAVTPEGDLLTAFGVVLSSADSAGSVMLENAGIALESALIALARAESLHSTARRDFEAARDLERAALERLEVSETALAGRSDAMGRLSRQMKSLEGEMGRLSERRASLGAAVEWAEGQIAALGSRLSLLEGEEAERLRVWEEMEHQRSEAQAEREAARSVWQEATGRLRAVAERRKLLEERSVRIALELERLGSGATTAVDVARLTTVEQTAREATRVIEGHIEELRERQSALRSAHVRAKEARDLALGEYESRREAVEGGRQRLAEIDIRLAELRLLQESVAEAIRRDAGTDIDAALAAPRPEVDADADLEDLLSTRLAQLTRLGPVNPLAAAEYRELSERHDFITAQMGDVQMSRQELRKVIEALEREIEGRFAAAFTEVAGAYERYFGALFPGGKGRLRLADPDDPHSGVEIDAQPMGKKVSQMTLLSGGERSLAALAFLFAIFESRPSPFYVLDEVEAALDDVNLRRFLRVVEEFRGRAQLIIVTHQQQTIEAADVLYGVTMEPGGASQALRKDMSKAMLDIVA